MELSVAAIEVGTVVGEDWAVGGEVASIAGEEEGRGSKGLEADVGREGTALPSEAKDTTSDSLSVSWKTQAKNSRIWS